MTCGKCGAETQRSGAKFCAECGAPLAVSCPQCGSQCRPGAKFCEECGTTLVATTTPPQPDRDTPKSFESEDTGRTNQPPAAERSERRAVTVMFADISGFTAMSEKLDPEEVTKIVNGAFERLSVPIRKYGGTIDKFIGDCVMVLFGAPVAHEDDPRRSILCAFEMRDEIAGYSRNVLQDLALSIGINTGEVLAGRVGSASKQDYTVMGDAVNLAQRLQSHAGRGKILVGPETLRLAGSGFAMEEVPALTVKGKKDPVRCFRIAGVTEKGPSEEKRVARPRVLIGRGKELQLVAQCCEESHKGEPQILAVMGETGLGKSALKEEWLSNLPPDSAPVLEIECSSGWQVQLRKICHFST